MTAYQQFHVGTGSLLAFWGDIGPEAKTNDTSAIGDVLASDLLPGSEDVHNFRKGQGERLPTGPNIAPNMADLGWESMS